MKTVLFHRHHGLHNPGETAAFSDAVARRLIAAGVASDPEAGTALVPVPAEPEQAEGQSGGEAEGAESGQPKLPAPTEPEPPPAA